MKIKNSINILFVTIIAACTTLSLTGCAKSVGKQITKDNFKDFYYTYSTTVNPPEFQRYRFYIENGTPFFYHEKREGNNTFLTEEDITVCGTKELSSDEWDIFWNFIDGGSVVKRKSNADSGNSGPWLYLYWNGDKDICQEFSFREDIDVYDFEKFCEELAKLQQEEADVAPSIAHDDLSFDRNVCGTYKCDAGDESEVRFWDISNIDGRYYFDYIGEYDYAAAEIELLDENPSLQGDELRYMVKVYPYSGFSFGGEYQGEGQVMYISSNVDLQGKRIELSPDNPFFYDSQTMYEIEGVSVHEIQDKHKTNNVAPEIVGSWRSVVKSGSEEYDVYLQFNEDGRVDIVRKKECYTPMVYRGVYSLENQNGKFVGKIEAEAMGMGSQPVADWILEFDPTSDSPIKITDEYDDKNPFVNDVADMMFTKTESGKHDKYIHPGPYTRKDEIAKMWEEYIHSDEE